jgi:hypothetical protein
MEAALRAAGIRPLVLPGRRIGTIHIGGLPGAEGTVGPLADLYRPMQGPG